MEDIGDILFYIIAAVIGLITTLGRKKKKPAGIPLPAENDEAGDIEYQDEDEFLIEEDALPAGERVISYEPAYDYNFDPENEGNFIEPIAEKLESVKKSQISEQEEILKEEISDSIKEEEDIILDFDLRQAVIYSEILKRNDY